MDGLELKVTPGDVSKFYLGNSGAEMQAKLEKIGSPLNFFLTPFSGIQSGMEVFGSFLGEKLGNSYPSFSTAVKGFGDSYRGLVALLEKGGITKEALGEHYTTLRCIAAAYKTLSTIPAPVPKGPEWAIQLTRATWWHLINGMRDVIITANELYSTRNAAGCITPYGTLATAGNQGSRPKAAAGTQTL